MLSLGLALQNHLNISLFQFFFLVSHPYTQIHHVEVVNLIPLHRYCTAQAILINFEKIFKWNIGALSLTPLQKSPYISLTLSDSITSTNLDLMAEFRVNMHSLSGIWIDVLDVQNEAYKPFKGGRSYVKSGRMVFRTVT